ncbi:GIY-YIG nuclease family protein [Flavobacterium sp. GT2N3]|uniref:GIY-YIG nuclease family protein n=1 Tax=unclassified Flavobacterium TaxID=196869 RepID=UPI003AAD18C7
MKPGFIYIITNKYQTVVYIGVTSNLPQRILEHKEKRYPNSFSARYNVNVLVIMNNSNGLVTPSQEKSK